MAKSNLDKKESSYSINIIENTSHKYLCTKFINQIQEMISLTHNYRHNIGDPHQIGLKAASIINGNLSERDCNQREISALEIAAGTNQYSAICVILVVNILIIFILIKSF